MVRDNPGRRGRRVIELARGRPERTESALEDRFLDLVDRHGLSRPRTQVQIEGHMVDFVWPEAKLIVETDGIAAHRLKTTIESDRLRDRAHLRAGYATIRLTDEAMNDEPAVVADLRRQLRVRSSAG